MFDTMTDLNNVLQPLQFPKSTEECRKEADTFMENVICPLRGKVAALEVISNAITHQCKSDLEYQRKYYKH